MQDSLDRAIGNSVQVQLLLNSALSDEGTLVEMPQVAVFISSSNCV